MSRRLGPSPPPFGGHLDTPAWKRYVARLCGEAWELDDAATAQVVAAIEALAAADDLSDDALQRVLVACGISSAAARLAAPGIRVAIDA